MKNISYPGRGFPVAGVLYDARFDAHECPAAFRRSAPYKGLHPLRGSAAM